MPSVWLAAVLTGPAVLLGSAFPGFGTLPSDDPAPQAVVEAIADAHVAAETGGHVAFNNPLASHRRQFALVRQLNKAIDRAESGTTVRLAAYSFAMPSTAEALLRAHRRGAAVRVLVDDHAARWGAVKELRRVLGGNVGKDSFVRACRLSCRGGRGNQHAKFVTISAGAHRGPKLLVGSVNLTRYSATRQWNDLYTVSDPGIHAQFARLFDLMATDHHQARLVLPVTGAGFLTDVSPYPHVRHDPIGVRLRQVRCRKAGLIAGRDGRTVVRISMHAWNGDRGVRLARKVAGLQRRGCDVKVLYGVGMGPMVTTILRRAHVPTRDSNHHGHRVHQKLMLVSGALGRQRVANYVWTGSHNWSDRSLRNDEVMLRIGGRGLVQDYLRNFRKIWRVAGR